MKSKYYNLRTLLVAVLSSLLFFGCIKDAGINADSHGIITISYTVDGMTAGTFSTAAEGHELAVNDVHILFYNMEGGGSDGYVTYQHASLIHGTSTFSFPIPEGLIPMTDYRTIVVGNAHSFVPSGFATFDDYLTACKSMTYNEAKQKLYAELSTPTMTYLPMWGQFVDGSGEEIPFRFESAVNTTITGTIHLSRSVCRMDMKNHAAKNLNIAWVKVCNYRSKGYYFHSEAPYGDIQSNLSSSAPTGIGDGYVRVSEPSNGVQQVRAQLYAFPNIVPVVAQNDTQTTYLMIAGYYQDGSGTANTTKLTYYRFNMAELGRSQILKRNYIYRASILSVKGPGADSEEGAKDETSPLLEYAVDDKWEDNNDDTATDDYGNYLILSRTQVSFADGVRGSAETVKVKVREGMTWEVIPAHSSTDRADAFSVTKLNDTSFSITTLLDNNSDWAYGGRLKVVGTTSRGTTLEVPVSLMQLSSANETQILLVDGRNGTLSRRIAGSGGMLNLQVQTGSSYAKWTVEDFENSFLAWTGGSFTSVGADKGILNITVPANITSAERTATLIVRRAGAKDVTIKLTQPQSDKLLTISPMPTDGALTVEGFDPAYGLPNGISFQKEFWVTLSDPTNYKITVSSDINSDHDMVLSKTNPLAKSTEATFPDTPTNTILTDLVNGNKFWINVFRTGPGDPAIKGTITVTAIPNTPGMATQEVSFSLNIVSSCSIGDVVVKRSNGTRFLVADRNAGALPRINEYGGFVTAINYSNLPEVHITGYPNADIQNTQFAGFYGEYSGTICAKEYADKNIDDSETYSPYYKSADRTKWYSPGKYNNWEPSMSQIIFTKHRPVIVSIENDTNGKYTGCFLPIAGYTSNPASTSGYYKSLEANGFITLTYKSIVGAISGSISAASIRCVRDLD